MPSRLASLPPAGEIAPVARPDAASTAACCGVSVPVAVSWRTCSAFWPAVTMPSPAAPARSGRAAPAQQAARRGAAGDHRGADSATALAIVLGLRTIARTVGTKPSACWTSRSAAFCSSDWRSVSTFFASFEAHAGPLGQLPGTPAGGQVGQAHSRLGHADDAARRGQAKVCRAASAPASFGVRSGIR